MIKIERVAIWLLNVARSSRDKGGGEIVYAKRCVTLNFHGSCRCYRMMMFSRHWKYKEKSRKIISVMVLYLGIFVVPNKSYSADQNRVQCLLSESISHTVIDISISNNTAQTIFLLWPDHLLYSSILTVSIEDEKENMYRYMPQPGPVYSMRRRYYKKLIPGSKVSGVLSLCKFLDHNNSHSPCSRPGEYKVEATYVNFDAEHWKYRKSVG